MSILSKKTPVYLTMAESGAIYGYMSEGKAPYKRLDQPEKSITLDDQEDALRLKREHDKAELEKIVRALQVHKTWIWNDGLRMVKLANRVETLENDMAELKATLERATKPSEN